MKYIHVYVLLLIQTNAAKDTVKPGTKDTVPSCSSNDPKIHTQYEYTDSICHTLNGLSQFILI